MRQFGKGEKVRFQKKKVKDGEKEPKRARKRKATEVAPAAATMSPAAHPADGLGLDGDEEVASGCAACASGGHRKHTCGKQLRSDGEKVASGCAACAGRHRTHTCGKEDSSAAQPSSTSNMGTEATAADRGERLGSSYLMVGP